MGFFSSLGQAVLNVAFVPVEVVKDVVTLGGGLTDEDEPYTLTRLKIAQQKINEVLEGE